MKFHLFYKLFKAIKLKDFKKLISIININFEKINFELT